VNGSSRALVVAIIAAATAACAGADGSTGLKEGGDAAGVRPSAGGVTGEHVIRGRIVGVDSAQGGEGYVAVAGATVRVVLLTRESAPGVDSSTVSPTRAEVGVASSDAEGRFTLAGVPAGYYALEVSTPAGAAYGGGTAYSIAFAQGAVGEALVYLYRR